MRCEVAPHVYQVVQDSIKSHYLLHSFAAAISDTISTTIATATASNLILNWNLFVFHFFPSKISWPHFAISACPRALSLPRNFGMPPYSTDYQKSCTNSDPDSIHGSSRGVSSTNSRCFVPRACIPLLSSAFLASVHHPSHMAHATIAVLNLGPEGLSWNRFLLAVSARFFTNPFSAFRASRSLRHFFPLKEPLLTHCKDERYLTLFAHYSHVLQWASCHC